MRQVFHHIAVTLVTMFLAFSITGCTGADDPSNLEPVLTILDATEITRNDATIAVEITNRGTGKLSRLEFMYAPANSTLFSSTESLEPVEGTVSVTLNNLKPGTTYTYYARGTAGKATLTTPSLSFTTQPNELPSVNPAHILSTGPTGVIIEFEIPEDGGERLLNAGCHVMNTSTGKRNIYSIEQDNLMPGVYRLSITGLSPLSDYSLTTFASNSLGINYSNAVNYKTEDAVVLTEAGSLSELFGEEGIQLSVLSIAGPMNGSDFRFLREALGTPLLPGETARPSSLSHLILTGVSITEGGASYDGSRFTRADTIDTGLFAECVSLQEIELPSSAKALMRDALRNCTGLTSIAVPAGIIYLEPSSGCSALENIEVSAANTLFSSHDGVLFNHEKTSILWFPRGKTGEFILPSTVTTISANAFSETTISTLTIPASVTVIERGAFAGSMLENITLPDNLRNLSAGTFQNCNCLKTIYTGKDLEFVGDYAFDGCRLEDLYLTATVPPYASTYAFSCHDYDLTANCILHVPAEARDRYRLHPQWGKFSKITGI